MDPLEIYSYLMKQHRNVYQEAQLFQQNRKDPASYLNELAHPFRPELSLRLEKDTLVAENSDSFSIKQKVADFRTLNAKETEASKKWDDLNGVLLNYQRFLTPYVLLNSLSVYNYIGEKTGLNKLKNAKVVDVGAGTGQIYGTFFFNQESIDYFLVDPNLRLIHDQFLRLYPKLVHYPLAHILSYAENLPFRSGFADLVMSISSIDHFKDYKQFIKEAHRILKPGGQILIASHLDETDHSPLPKIPSELNQTSEQKPLVQKIYNRLALKYEHLAKKYHNKKRGKVIDDHMHHFENTKVLEDALKENGFEIEQAEVFRHNFFIKAKKKGVSSETNSKLNILVISFYFPPYDKVGGRRWAKHCKYFEKEKIDLWVLAGDFKGSSAWDKDIASYSDKITRVKLTRKYLPYHLTTLPKNIFQKIKWKLSLMNWERKKTTLKENYNDVSLGNETAFEENAKNIIKKRSIDTVIISTGPFSYSRIFPHLRSEFPNLKLIIDYRDYWEDTLKGLSQDQVNADLELQKKVISSVDLILSPNPEMRKHYLETFKKNSYCLPHCYDDSEILQTAPVKKEPSDVITLVYGGAFYAGIEANIILIKQFIDELSKSKRTKADLYVSIKGYEKEFTHPSIRRFDYIESEKYFGKVRNADYAVLILPPNRVNAMSSKFYELVAMRVPILYFGGKGSVSEFLTEHNLGFHITGENMKEQAGRVVSNLGDRIIPDLKYDVTEHTFARQTRLLIDALKTA